LEESKEKELKASNEADRITKAKNKLLSTVSHEVRTPMNGVIGMVSLLEETPLTKEQSDYTSTILSCSKNLLTKINDILINDILDFSKIDSNDGQLVHKSFDLRNCIEEVMEMFSAKAAETGLDLVYKIDDDVPLEITGDNKRLQQVLINLVENAVKFTRWGEILVNVKLLKNEDDQLELGFEVSDTGMGIEANKLERVFTGLPSNTSAKNSYSETGLGLMICKTLVEQMGGKISAENRAGQGTSIKFSIAVKGSIETTRNYASYSIAHMEGKNILIVDDNLTAGNILKNQLEHWKLLPVVATSGKGALDVLTQVSFDLVITDLNMPEMDGILLAQLIKSQYPKIPVILLNASNDEKYKKHPELFNAVLNKPAKQHVLFDSILSELRHKDREVINDKSATTKLSQAFSQQYPLNILIAEDNPINQKWTTKILSKLGYKTHLAENGKEVLEVVSNEQYDVILMDVQMPEMDGLEATRMIRLCLQTQPVIIAMTANVLHGDRQACMQAGMDDYISKPVELNELVNMLEKWALQIKEKREVSV
jgi:CheY-like chemotaxis protein/nitrogen-specific signal transduction histidine kinase